MPGPVLDPCETDTDLPDRGDVVIVGGGVIGLATALCLVERGLSVVVCEKGRIAGEQSSRNWGWCRVTRRDPREIPLAVEALRLWPGMNERIEGETGFRAAGILYGCDDERAIAAAEAWLEAAQPFQVGSRIIGEEAVAALLPGAGRPVRAGLHTPSDGRAEPQKAGPAMARAVRARGGRVVETCAVRTLDHVAGRVAGVVTERGRIAADAVVLAGGAWSRLFALGQGLTLPQLKVLNTVVRTGPVEGGPDGAGLIGDFAFRKRLDGGYTLSHDINNVVQIVPDTLRFARQFMPAYWLERRHMRLRLGRRFFDEWREGRAPEADRVSVFEKIRVLDPEPDARSAGAAIKAARVFFPLLEGVEVVQAWAGMIDATPDALPVISPVEGEEGFFIATGFSGHGFGISPAAGQLCADLVTGDTPIVDPSPFRFSRFSDGTPVRPMTGF
jgi:glycine/D-amino acid oxidase-like deaminating enzyme